MDLKKAQLSDEAALYNHNEEKTDKQKWAEMNNKQRFDFFMAYYFWKLVFIVAVGAFCIYFIYTLVKPKPNMVLNIAANGYLTVQFSELSNQFLDLKELDKKKNEINVDPTYNLNTDTTSMQRFNIFCFTGDVDMLISSPEAFERYASMGFMKPLDEIMSAEQLAWFEEHGLTYTTSRKDTDDNNVVIKEYEPRIYGIILDNTTVFDEFTDHGNVIIGVITKSSRKQNAVDYIQFLYDKYGKQ